MLQGTWGKLGIAIISALVLGSVSYAEERTFEGVLVDPATYLQQGRYDLDSTELALDGGQSLAVLDPATQALYLLLAEQAGEDPNELVYDFLDQARVKCTGDVYERDGVRGLVLKKVEPLTPPAAP
jgi:hypothetical protein